MGKSGTPVSMVNVQDNGEGPTIITEQEWGLAFHCFVPITEHRLYLTTSSHVASLGNFFSFT